MSARCYNEDGDEGEDDNECKHSAGRRIASTYSLIGEGQVGLFARWLKECGRCFRLQETFWIERWIFGFRICRICFSDGS